MPDYFTSDHFKLLNKWKGEKRDESNPEQNRAYATLGEANELVKKWATHVQSELFPQGRVFQRGLEWQSNVFPRYIGAHIYPDAGSPVELVYTLSINPGEGFVVRLGTIGLDIDHPIRKAFLLLAHAQSGKEINVLKLPESEGLTKNIEQLARWSAEAILNFKLRYDDVAEKLELSADEDHKSLLAHFQGHEDFVERQPLWTSTTTELFGRLARAVNEMGLDWWFTRATNSQLRFGRKEKEADRGSPVGWLFLRKEGIRVSWSAFAGLAELESTDLTSEVVQLFEAADKDEGTWPAKLGTISGRDGFWPNDYTIEVEHKSDKPSRNVIYYGPPGTGKTFDLQALLVSDYTDAVNGERYEFVTFHQSYGYEEFVEGIRPVITKRGKQHAVESEAASASNGEVRYEIKPGAFLRLCDRARKNPSRQYAMVIDEINRGNISKIFGELITLLEVDKREGAKYPVSVTLPYSAESFSVPPNVDVIGTMNTADRSLALVDTALRRRFEFIESMPKPSVLAGTIVSHNGVDINIEQLLTMMNKRIEALYDRDHTVGHAYFTRLKDMKEADRFSELKTVFRNKIIPLLEEYFFEDWQKIRLVLADNQKVKREHQFVLEIGRDDDLLALFGRERELDQYAIRARFQLNADALDQPDAYVGIYAATLP